MKKAMTSVIAAACAACLGAIPVKAADDMMKESSAQSAASPHKVVTRQTSLQGTVQSINYETRDITLKGAKGNEMSFQADPEVKRFNEVKKGDKVKIDYLESVALTLKKPGEALPPAADTVTVAPNNGTKPSGVAAETRQVTATVESVNMQKKEVTLRGPEGNAVTLDVSPETASKVKTGDKVVAQYTQAIAVDVSKP